MWTTVVCDVEDSWWGIIIALPTTAMSGECFYRRWQQMQFARSERISKRTDRQTDRRAEGRQTKKHLNFDIKVGTAYSASWLAAGARSILNARKYSCCRWAWPKVKQQQQKQDTLSKQEPPVQKSKNLPPTIYIYIYIHIYRADRSHLWLHFALKGFFSLFVCSLADQK